MQQKKPMIECDNTNECSIFWVSILLLRVAITKEHRSELATYLRACCVSKQNERKNAEPEFLNLTFVLCVVSIFNDHQLYRRTEFIKDDSKIGIWKKRNLPKASNLRSRPSTFMVH